VELQTTGSHRGTRRCWRESGHRGDAARSWRWPSTRSGEAKAAG
jgi:hypothetical protein